jgi:hypothetical protein
MAQTFSELDWLDALMGTFPHPWYVAGGWAIDLHVGRVTRDHGDAEVAVLRRDQEALRHHLADWEFRHAIPGRPGDLEPWREGTQLELPIQEIHAVGPEDVELEILLNESTGGVWRFRRMMEIARPLSKLGRVSSPGIPYLAPEVVLLYKAKNPTESDERDFQVALPLLGEEPSEWLRISVEACYPEHHWLENL